MDAETSARKRTAESLSIAKARGITAISVNDPEYVRNSRLLFMQEIRGLIFFASKVEVTGNVYF